MGYLNNKRILFIAPNFFGYELDIKKEMEQQGAKVTFVPDSKPSLCNRVLSKICLKFHEIEQRNKKKLVSQKYDMLFLIKGNYVTTDLLNSFKYNNPNAYCIMYQYDSLFRYPNIRKLFPYFNDIYSFDYNDCFTEQDYGIRLLPLFYTKKFDSDTFTNIKKEKYDISSVATYYKSRFIIIKDLKKYFAKTDINLRIHLYCYIGTIIKNFQKIKFEELKAIRIYSLKKEKTAEMIKLSKAVLDMPFENQKGLTMRTFETIGMHKKLITTNYEVKKYDFYNPNNIYVINKSNMDGISLFLKAPYQPVNRDILDKYKLETFCRVIFKQSEYNYINN